MYAFVVSKQQIISSLLDPQRSKKERKKGKKKFLKLFSND